MDRSRRTFVKTTGLLGAAALAAGPRASYAWAQTSKRHPAVKMVQTVWLNIGYEDLGSPSGTPVLLLHGFPYDALAWHDVGTILADQGYRAIIPYLRGYGPTTFRDPAAPGTAEQAAIGQDVIDLADALGLRRFALAGFDWGNRAACIASALHPDRVLGFVSCSGYTIQNTVDAARAGSAESARRAWYQWYFNTEQGRVGLETNRRAVCRLLWEEWSPTWQFTDETYNRTADSFDNPKWVEVVLHSYRHRHRNAPGETRFLEVERQLATRPKITVPSIVLHEEAGDYSGDRRDFSGLVESRLVEAGHAMPAMRPDAVAQAIMDLLGTRAASDGVRGKG
jgi:pimeloyl-ACP methyl ester carboxylesterase